MLIRLHWVLVTKENRKDHNSDWLRIPDHPYKLLIIGESVSGEKSNI